MRLFLILSIFPSFALAQDISLAGRSELSGRLSYTYSKSFFDLDMPSSGAYMKFHTIAITPGYGYFMTENVEALLDLRYDLSIWSGGSRYPWARYETHRLGFAFGLSYNLSVTARFVPLAGIKYGVRWPRQIGGSSLGWGGPEVSFPDVFLGARFFASPNWSAVLMANYSKTKLQEKIETWGKEDKFQFALGFSVIL